MKNLLGIFLILASFEALACKMKPETHQARGDELAREIISKDVRFKFKVIHHLKRANDPFLYSVSNSSDCQLVKVNITTKPDCKMSAKIESIKTCQKGHKETKK